MDEMVILCAILVVGPFLFFIVMVCSLKIFGYLNIDLFKPGTSPSVSEADPNSRRHRSLYTDGDDGIDEDYIYEQYAFRDRWTTGLSIAANLPIHIAMTEIPLSTSILNSHSQTSSQVPHSHSRPRTSYSRPQIRGQSSADSCPPTTATIPASSTEIEMSIPRYHEITLEDINININSEPPPPDYNHARLLKVQAEQHDIPPPTYTECMKMKMKNIRKSIHS